MRLDERRFGRAVSRFVRQLAPKAAEQAVKKIALDVTREILVSLNGVTGLPKRIDTGRYRAAWASGTEIAVGSRAGLPTAPSSSSTENPSRSGDGAGTFAKSGARSAITVTNNVEYGPHLEYGTQAMAAGWHRGTALAKVGREVEEVAEAAMRDAWGA